MLRLLCLLTLVPEVAFAQARILRAGAASVDITPSVLPVITNCQMLERTADKVTGPLHARALVLDDGAARIAITVVDSCMLPRELLDLAKEMARLETGIAAERMLVSATHSHTAPSSMACLGSDMQLDYAAGLPGKIAAAIAAAARNLQPARIGWAVEDDTAHTHCRRWIFRPDKIRKDPFGNLTVRANMHPGYENPDAVTESGPVDPALTVLSVQTTQGQPLALLANYSMHYFGDTQVSSDYYGRFASKIAARIGAPETFTGIMSQGTSGDQMWMDYGKPKSSLAIEQYADGVVETAFKAYAKVRYRNWVPLAMAETLLTLKRRAPDEERLRWARAIVERMGARKPRDQTEVYAREQIFLHQEPERELRLQAIRIGEFAITAIPNEAYGLTGLKLKARSPFPLTMNIALANGAEGYIPPPEQHKLGGYTTWPARTAGLEVTAEPKITEALLRLLEKVSGKERRTPVAAVGSYSRAVSASKPAAYFRLHEMGGTVARDSMGGPPASCDGRAAHYLAGPDDGSRAAYLAGGRIVTPPRDLGQSYSVELWFWSGAPPKTVFSVGGDSWKAPTGLPLRQWQHAVLVRDGSRIRLYRNAKLISESEAAGNTGTLIAGGDFEGKVSEVAVYRRVLAEQEITAHYQAAKP
ncbi:MAG: LamG domain-containing protein [Bryobacterales bacterium]|nr:LamG domain-containing protein [Bryobacterales bacterium]